MSNGDMFDEKTDAMIFYAFRYCLGRASYAVWHCADYLIENWARLSLETRSKIHREINVAFKNNMYGHEGDREDWQRVLDTPA